MKRFHLLATLSFALLIWTVYPVSADVIVSDSVSASSTASTFSGTHSQTNPTSGVGSQNVASTASSFTFLSGFGTNSSSSGLTVTTNPNGTVTITGSLSNTGSALGLAGSFGSSSFSGSIDLTGEYKYILAATGALDPDLLAINSNSLSILGFGPLSGAFSTGGTGFVGPGSFAFAGSASGASGLLGFDSASVNFTLTLIPVPEPTTILVLGAGLLGMAGYGWRRRKVFPVF